MESCVDPEIGGLLPFYELNALSQDEMNAFEVHLLDCEFCFHELAASHETTRLVSRNADALKSHYEEANHGFAVELAKLSKGESRRSPRNRFASGLALLTKWLSERLPRAVLVPVTAVAALGLVFFLRQLPSPYLAFKSDPEMQAPVEKGAQPLGEDATTRQEELSSDTLKTDGIRGTEPAIQGKDLTINNVPTSAHTKTPPEISKELSALLPIAAIPFTGLITRGSSADSAPASGNSDSAKMVQQGMDMYAAGDYVASAAILSRAVLDRPHDSRALTYLGSSLYMSRDYEGAAKAFKKAAFYAGDTADPQVFLYLASALIRTRQSSEAEGILVSLTKSPDRTMAQLSEKILNKIRAEKR